MDLEIGLDEMLAYVSCEDEGDESLISAREWCRFCVAWRCGFQIAVLRARARFSRVRGMRE